MRLVDVQIQIGSQFPMRRQLGVVLIVVLKDTLLKTVGGNQRIEAVSETLTVLVGVSVETLDVKAVSVETLIIQVEPRARAELDRETTDGSCRVTRLLPAGSSEWLPAIHGQRVQGT